MTSVYLDHNVTIHLATPLRAGGQEVVSARDLALVRLTDDAQLLTAAQSGRTLVTHNRLDFVLLHDAWMTWPERLGVSPFVHAGILVLEAAMTPDLVDALREVLRERSADELHNQLFWWRKSHGWRRRLVGQGWEAL